MITSPANEKLKLVRKLTRHAERAKDTPTPRFAAEGEDLVEAAQAAGWSALDVLVAADTGIEGTEVEPDLLAKASGLGSGTRAIGIYEQRWADKPVGPVCIALFGVGDPGNVGTVLRGALALGAHSVALGPGCADPFGPKAVRASMGAIFHVPVCRADGVEGLPKPTIALAAREGNTLRGPGEGTLLIGAERTGLPEAVKAAADEVAHVVIAGASESLNAAMAATVALYELTRQP
ncbi:MAG TPA: RNA methyltransferase [Solirubrobacteraceae bacterium]|nr:RNA methyltransferase [Solirubrobacteraceae bacterium]